MSRRIRLLYSRYQPEQILSHPHLSLAHYLFTSPPPSSFSFFPSHSIYQVSGKDASKRKEKKRKKMTTNLFKPNHAILHKADTLEAERRWAKEKEEGGGEGGVGGKGSYLPSYPTDWGRGRGRGVGGGGSIPTLPCCRHGMYPQRQLVPTKRHAGKFYYIRVGGHAIYSISPTEQGFEFFERREKKREGKRKEKVVRLGGYE